MADKIEPFLFKKIDFTDKAMMDRLYQLRFQVYGEECGFINQADYPDGRESDEYDSQSVHFAAMDTSGEMIGTVRLIMPGPRVLPIQKHCPDLKIGNAALPQIQFAEISRLIISRRLRRRRDDGQFYESQVSDYIFSDDDGQQYMRRAKPMAFGLYRELYRESKRIGITHWYTLMEKSLWLLLRIHGFSFSPIGPEVDVYGPVRPYIGKIEQMEEEVAKKFPQFFTYFSSDAELTQDQNRPFNF
ncbi:MAG: PEP-CTERM/exosortase system-associated acyltransferase [Candidatus Omnitrophica bacterium]|nr:PEP-CTERM/exosortase system-associated acyltransferase [Candidatus Omnitrophota bacterium]